ncbi:MAG: MerR family transcriptional regulator [Microbacteriaceae bacterium]
MAAGNAARAQAAVAPSLLSIGQVLAKLTPDFPELTPSKLRFLEERQLVSPTRTATGYRKFSPADLERLRFVLTMQRDHYLPLKVIRGYLAELDAGRQPELPATSPAASMLPGARRLTREELLREAHASATLLGEAIAAGLVAGAESYGEEALHLLRALVELRRSGIEPRHLRGVRTAVEREAALIQSAVRPTARPTDGASRSHTVELARELAAQVEIVRSSLMRGCLSGLEP